MAYFAPYIDAAGLHIPTFQDMVDDLVSQAKTIYGQDIYLGVDSPDYQYISSVSAKIYDAMQLLQFVYTGRSPATAIGAALESLVKLNGIRKKPAGYSTCLVTLTGAAGTEITSGIVQDVSGYKWTLPSPITIGVGGTVTVTATCQTAGPVAANPGDINKIVTPTYGWTSVTNSGSATPGSSVETDSALRARQAISSGLPSRTVIEGTQAAIAAVSGVTRSKVYENDQADTAGYEASGANPSTNISAGPANKFQIAVDADVSADSYHDVTLTLTGLITGAAIATQMQTQIQALGGIYAGVTVAYSSTGFVGYVVTSGTKGIGSMVRAKPASSGDVSAVLKLGIANGATDVNGWPGHSITSVVEGGTDSDVATAIWAHKGPGALANGTTSVTLTDDYGLTTAIGFYRPTYVDFDVVVNVKSLPGYTSATTDAIKAALVAYLSSLALGSDRLLVSSLWGSALSVQDLAQPVFSIVSLTAARHGGTQAAVDIGLAFNEVARGNSAYITINVS